MTDRERDEINPKVCAEGLRYILHRYYNLFDFPETAIIVGSISLLRNKSDNYPYLKADDNWKQQIIK